jgi:hypothetical protein
MSIDDSYFRYLEHFGATATVRDLWQEPDRENVVGLRHDVDYDLDLALEIAYWEHEQGCRSTYYLLHSSAYWNDPQFLDKCAQLQEFDHEIGLHLDVLAEWFRGDISDVDARLSDLLSRLRGGGIQVVGSAAHGSPSCYKHQFINYWCFAELRPNDPASSETGLTAEGILSKDPRFRISYPADGRLLRDDGEVLELWESSMSELGLEYEAIRVPNAHYWSDSGGRWVRSPDPLGHSLKSGRHQVLMHPEYWRGPQRLYFFLSTARSGSKWLSRVLNEATSVKSKHEFMLNHRYQNETLASEHRTGAGFADLMDRQAEVKRLVEEAGEWIERQTHDYAEVNVYLPHVLQSVKDVFPEAVLVHLHRDPAEVVQSIINRDWYDTPEDNRHPRMDVPGWKRLSQFEKSCWYVTKTNQLLSEQCHIELRFATMVANRGYLASTLKSIGVAYYPRLARDAFSEVVDPTRSADMPSYRMWSEDEKATFHRVSDAIRHELGYDGVGSQQSSPSRRLVGLAQDRDVVPVDVGTPERMWEATFDNDSKERFSAKGCKTVLEEDGLKISPQINGHAHVVLRGKWAAVEENEGWRAERAAYFRGEIEGRSIGNGEAVVFCLTYGDDGKQIGRRQLGRLTTSSKPISFSFRPRPTARKFTLALFMNSKRLPHEVILRSAFLERVPLISGGKSGPAENRGISAG